MPRKFHRLLMIAARKEALAAGAECELHVEQGGRHGKLHILYRGKCRTTPVSISPSSDLEDAVRMKVSDIRRILREMMDTGGANRSRPHIR